MFLIISKSLDIKPSKWRETDGASESCTGRARHARVPAESWLRQNLVRRQHAHPPTKYTPLWGGTPAFPSSLDASDVRRMLAGPRAAYRQVSERAHRPAWHGVNRPTDELTVGLLGPANEMNTNRRWISQIPPFGMSVGLSRGHSFLQLFVSHASNECGLLWHRRGAVGRTTWVHALSHTLCQPKYLITCRYRKIAERGDPGRVEAVSRA